MYDKNGPVKNSLSFKSDFLKSIIKFHLASYLKKLKDIKNPPNQCLSKFNNNNNNKNNNNNNNNNSKVTPLE